MKIGVNLITFGPGATEDALARWAGFAESVGYHFMMLGDHVTQKTADTFGVKIHADVVHPGEHRMMMVLEAPAQGPIDNFLQPFSMVGTVDVKEVTTCEQVVETATC